MPVFFYARISLMSEYTKRKLQAALSKRHAYSFLDFLHLMPLIPQ